MHKIIYRLLVLVVMLLGGTQAYQSQTSVGGTLDGIVTYVIDGDTLRVNGVKVRIWGIDAPEKDQPYYDEATRVLQAQSLFHAVTCSVKDQDRYGRLVAQCLRRKDQKDIAAIMVQNGLARDYARHSKRYYLPQQIKAQAQRKGLWKSSR